MTNVALQGPEALRAYGAGGKRMAVRLVAFPRGLGALRAPGSGSRHTEYD